MVKKKNEDDPGGGTTSRKSSSASSERKLSIASDDGNTRPADEEKGARAMGISTVPREEEEMMEAPMPGTLARWPSEEFYEADRKARLRYNVKLYKSKKDPVPEPWPNNLAPGTGGYIDGKGYPPPNIDNFVEPAVVATEYTGKTGALNHLADIRMKKARYELPKKIETVADLTNTALHRMSIREAYENAIGWNKNIDNNDRKWTFPTILQMDKEDKVRLMVQNRLEGDVKEAFLSSVDKLGYRETTKGECKQPYTVLFAEHKTVEYLKKKSPEKTLVEMPSGLPGYMKGKELEPIRPCPEGMRSYTKPERREILPVHCLPLKKEWAATEDDITAEKMEWPMSEGLSFHMPRFAIVRGPNDTKRLMYFPAQDRDVSINPVFMKITDALQDGVFLWKTGSEHSRCESPTRPVWFGNDIWAGGVLDIGQDKRLYGLPGFVTLTDEQIREKRPFACMSNSQAMWVDMMENILKRQHHIRDGERRWTYGYVHGSLGTLTIYWLDREIRPARPENYLPETKRLVNVAVPKAHLINLINSAVYAVTCAAKGRALCRARNKMKETNPELTACYEEYWGHAEAALDMRFRAACECYRLARADLLKDTITTKGLVYNQSRLYVPSTELSRALVQLSLIDTLTMRRDEMQLYRGSDEERTKKEDTRYKKSLSVNPSATIGLPMPVNDLVYLWHGMASILQASLLHLDAVMMAVLPRSKDCELPADDVEWLPNQAAYVMGRARDVYEAGVRDKVIPRLIELMKTTEYPVEWKCPLSVRYPKIRNAERALKVEHPTCLAWRYTSPPEWETKGVYPQMAGYAYLGDDEHPLPVGNPQRNDEYFTPQEKYVDMLAAVNVETIRRPEWDPDNEKSWVTRIEGIDKAKRPNFMISDVWQRHRQRLVRVFEKKNLKRVNQYLADNAVDSATTALKADVSVTIIDADKWMKTRGPWEPEQRLAQSAPVERKGATSGAPTATTDERMETDQPVNEEIPPPPPPPEEEMETGVQAPPKTEPPPPEKAKLQTQEKRRRSPSVSASEEDSQLSDSAQQDGDETADDDEQVPDPLAGDDPDYAIVAFGLSKSERERIPPVEEWLSTPETAHWNLLQHRTSKRDWTAALREEKPTEGKSGEISSFCLKKLGIEDQPLRSKARVRALVQHLQVTEADWQKEAIERMTMNNRYEFMDKRHPLMRAAETICGRDAKLALGNALTATLAAPVEVPGTPPENQPGKTLMDYLERHNQEVESVRGITAFTDPEVSTEKIDAANMKLPHSKEFLFDRYMLATEEELTCLVEVSEARKKAIDELKTWEQHCYVPLEGRSYIETTEKKFREAVEYHLEYTRRVQTYRQRVRAAFETSTLVLTDAKLLNMQEEAQKHNDTQTGPEKSLVDLVLFCSLKDFEEKKSNAKTIAAYPCPREWKWVRLPTGTTLTTDLVKPAAIMNDTTGSVLASCTMLLGVRVYNDWKKLSDRTVHWYHPGFCLKALGDKKTDGTSRKRTCVHVFRAKPIRRTVKLDQELLQCPDLQCEEMWLEKKLFRRISNQPDDEYKTAAGYGHDIASCPTSLLRKMIGGDKAWDLVGEFEKIPGTLSEYRCRGCGIKYEKGATDHEFCLFRPKNHQFGTIMLKIWSNPDSKLPLPEESARLRQKQRMLADRVELAVAACFDPMNELSIPEIAEANRLDPLWLSNEVERRQKGKTGGDLDELPSQEDEASKLEEMKKATTYHKGGKDPCGNCGSTRHATAKCNASALVRAKHREAVLAALAKPTTSKAHTKKEQPATSSTSEPQQDWREKARRDMLKGKPLKMLASKPDATTPSLEALVAARVPPLRAVLKRDGSTSSDAEPQGKRGKLERDLSIDRSSMASSSSSRGGRGGFKGFKHPRYGEHKWASSHRARSPRRDPSRSRSRHTEDERRHGASFSKSYTGPTKMGISRPSTSGMGPPRTYDPNWRDLESSAIVTARATPPPGIELPYGWDYVQTVGSKKARLRARDCAKVRGRKREFFSRLKHLNEELCRSVYENLGFMPKLLRRCAAADATLPGKATEADRRVPCSANELGAFGHEEVWTKWSGIEKDAHDAFYSSGDYALLKSRWCLTCLCPGHYATTCRLEKKDGSRVECDYCGDGTHERSVCPLQEQHVGCDQCGSMNHGRLKCPYNRPLEGDSTCSVRYSLLKKYAKFLPEFYENPADHAAIQAQSWELIDQKNGKALFGELMRVLRTLGAAEGYY